MNRLLKQALSVNTLRKSLGFSRIFSATKFDLRTGIIDKFEFKNVLILAPHPDDDALGMGGTIKKMTTRGIKVVVAYLCDGAAGLPIGNPKKRSDELVVKRKAETAEAAKILGITQTFFFGYPDGKLAASNSAIMAIKDLIEKGKPDIIFLPSFLDNHSDHRLTNDIFINAATSVLKADFPVWGYEVWTPTFANRIIDITLYIKTKKEAILAHKSQIESRGYDKAMEGLNQYRAEINSLDGYAEGFFAAPLGVYKELYRKS